MDEEAKEGICTRQEQKFRSPKDGRITRGGSVPRVTLYTPFFVAF